MSRRPILALDVDGPINTFGSSGGLEAYECYAGDIPLTIPHAVPGFLRQLHVHFQIVWFSSWGRSANQYVSPLVGLPTNLPVIDFDRYGTGEAGESRKLKGLLHWLDESASIAIVDDEIGRDMEAWARERLAPTLLIEVDSRIGLQAEQVAQLTGFVENLEWQ